MRPSKYAFTFFCITTVLALSSQFPVAADEKKEEAGWVQLFNGKDLTGWKIHPMPSPNIVEVITIEKGGKVTGYDGRLKADAPKNPAVKGEGKIVHLWRVEDGMLIGSGPPSHLFSERDDYTDFQFRVEVKINDKGNSGQYFRTAFGPGFPKGYETQINATHGDPVKTGSIYPATKDLRDIKEIQVLKTAPHQPDEFFTQEVTAIGDTITVAVNGKTTVDHWKDPQARYKKGHFALQGHDPGTVVTFKKVEVKELKK